MKAKGYSLHFGWDVEWAELSFRLSEAKESQELMAKEQSRQCARVKVKYTRAWKVGINK